MKGPPAAASAAAAAAGLAAKRLTVEHAGESRALLLVEGAEAASLAQALAGWLGHSRFYLTLPGDDAIVPLTAALPSGLTLALHVPARASAAPSGRRRAHSAWAAEPGGGAHGEGAAPARRRALTAAYEPAEAEGSQAGKQQRDLTRQSSFHLWRTAPMELAVGLLAEDPAPLDAVAESHPEDARRAPWSSSDPDAHDDDGDAFAEHGESPKLRRSETVLTNTGMAEVEEAVANLDRFSRLSTDLANERTLLAWMRTSMAAFRSACCFLSIAGGFSYNAARVMMVVACVWSAVSGIRRYQKIKQVTFALVPPKEFGRVSIWWFAFLMVICNVAIATGMVSPYWSKS